MSDITATKITGGWAVVANTPNARKWFGSKEILFYEDREWRIAREDARQMFKVSEVVPRCGQAERDLALIAQHKAENV